MRITGRASPLSARSSDAARAPAGLGRCRRADRSGSRRSRSRSRPCARLMLAWKSSATAIGTVRRQRPDAAEQLALAIVVARRPIAPCSASSTASQPSATAPVIAPAKVSKASSSTRPLGGAPPAIGITISAPAFRATSISPPSEVLVPAKRASAASAPNTGPARPVPIWNASSGVAIGEKVLVSCIISASTRRIGSVSRLSRLSARSAGSPGWRRRARRGSATGPAW